MPPHPLQVKDADDVQLLQHLPAKGQSMGRAWPPRGGEGVEDAGEEFGARDGSRVCVSRAVGRVDDWDTITFVPLATP